MKAALIVIDMQNVSYFGPSVQAMDGAATIINRVLPFFRDKGLPVVWVLNEDGNRSVPGSAAFEMIPSLKALPGEKIIHKRAQNSFIKTELGEYLKGEGVDTPIISGYAAEYCVLSTYRGASENDYEPLLLRKGIASSNPAHTGMVEAICESLTPLALRKLLEV
jgi:nicotinamidase-related amidase